MVLIELDSAVPGAVDGRKIRAVAFQEVRLQYIRGLGLTGGKALVVGGGRGLLPNGLAELGFDVVATEPSEAAAAMAREAGVTVVPENEVAAGAYDLVYVADTFEITPDLAGVVERVSRALKPGGVLVYDSVNRNPLSKLVYLGLFQGLGWTRIMPPGRYAADRLRKPAELVAALARQGLRNEDISGFKPKNPLKLLTGVLAVRSGKTAVEEIARMVDMVLVGPPVVTYLGSARKT
jgi:2-polyprenyl-6-hydroxyphenyl methylase/3-demethylubiquinone-9 3-methyltransferase